MPQTRETFDDLPILSELHADLVKACSAQEHRHRTATLLPVRRWWSRPTRLAAAAAAPALAVAAVIIATTGAPAGHTPAPVVTHTGGAQTPVTDGGGPAVHTASPLVRLADYVVKSPTPAGDATLVARTTPLGGGESVTVYDLYTDSGKYFFSQTEHGLAAQVSTGHSLGGGLFAREVAAAKLAAAGNVQKAGEEMAAAPAPSKYVPQKTQLQKVSRRDATKPGVHPGELVGTLYDNYVWENSQDALIAGSSDPQVRAGVLRILATLPDITITRGTSAGQPTLVLTAGTAEVGAGSTQQLTINATTGVPVSLASGPAGQTPSGAVTYRVSRVTTTDVAVGKLRP